MMQYYPYLLIFVVMDVISMFLFAWATTTISLSTIDSALVIGLFLLIIFMSLGFGLRLAGKKEIW